MSFEEPEWWTNEEDCEDFLGLSFNRSLDWENSEKKIDH